MIVLDTKVVSEMMRPEPDDVVRRWLDRQAAEPVSLSRITVSEPLSGIGAVDAGRGRDGLAALLRQTLDLYAGRVLSFDQNAAWHHADLAVAARRAGRGCPVPNSYISWTAV